MSVGKNSPSSVLEMLEFLVLLESGDYSKRLSRPLEPSSLDPIIDYLNRLAETLASKAQAQVRSQSEKDWFLSLISSISDEVWFADNEKRFSLANPAALKEFRLSSVSELDIEKFAASLEAFRPDGSPRSVEEAPPLRALKGEKISKMEEIVRTPGTGELRYRQVSANPVKDVAGNIIGSVCVVRDITDQKRAEEALQSSRNQMHSIMENMSEGLMIFNPRGDVTYQNPASLKIHGFDLRLGAQIERSALSMTWSFWDEAGKPLSLDSWPMSRVRRRERFKDQVLRARRMDTQHEFWASYNGSPIFDSKGDFKLSFITIHDITKHKKAELSLKESEHRFRTLFETMAQGVVYQAADGSMIAANAAAQEILGLSIEQMQDRTSIDPRWLSIREDGSELPGTEHPSMVALRTGKPVYNVIMGIIHPGESAHRWLLINAVPEFLPGQKNPHQVYTTFTDITERKLAECREVERSTAEKANRTKDLFLATLSHELRTPLTAILSWAQMLQSGRLDPSKVGVGLQTIEEAAQAQNQLISDLLDISRITSGKVAMDMQEVELTSVLSCVVEMVRISAEKKAIHVCERLGSVPVFVSGDPGRLKQVVWNLLVNAIKFSNPGGKIEVSVETTTDDRGSRAQIRVRDTGKGIPSEFLPHIFEQFSQADSSSTRVHGGLGLGLALAHGLVKLHGGKIEAQSEGVGKGSTFTVTLPLSVVSRNSSLLYESQTAGMISPENSAAEPTLSGVRILLVDDELSTLSSIRETLSIFQAKVNTALSVSEAMVEFERSKPDVIVSDIAMPNEDGYSLIRKIRQLGHEKGGDTPAVALTAYADAETRQKALASGFQAHLAKPVDSHELMRVILSARKASSWVR